jgi:hypothetical protein
VILDEHKHSKVFPHYELQLFHKLKLTEQPEIDVIIIAKIEQLPYEKENIGLKSFRINILFDKNFPIIT